MSEDNKRKDSLTDEDMVTSPRLSRRLLLASAGVALGTATLGGGAAFAEDKDKGAMHKDEADDADMADVEKDKGDMAKDDADKGDREKDQTDKDDRRKDEERDSD